MSQVRVLISFDLPSAYVKKIQDVAANVEVVQSEEEKELLGLVKDADVLFAGFFSPKMFLSARRLKWIQTAGAGVDRFLFPEVVKSRVVVTNAGGVHPIPVSEHAIGMMFCFCRKLHLFVRNQTQRQWKRYDSWTSVEQVEELSGKTVGIVGLGRIGGEIAEKAKCLGMKVLATRRDPSRPLPGYVDRVIDPKDLKELLAESDFVVLSLPLTKETERMIGEDQLRSMKRTGYLINVSRGRIVQEDRLTHALKEGWIAGAGLDTFENEPLPPDSELWGFENVIITPHVAGLTPHYLERLTGIFCENLTRFLRNEPLINVVDKALGY
jgi:D-2-hydroxyacid dehydrogenase (NADP+)